jgi:plasmid maintenance system antidote protein VapI
MKLTDIQIQTVTDLKQSGDRDKLALLLKCTPETISRITNGKQDTSLQNIKLIVKFYLKRQKAIINLQKKLKSYENR